MNKMLKLYKKMVIFFYYNLNYILLIDIDAIVIYAIVINILKIYIINIYE